MSGPDCDDPEGDGWVDEGPGDGDPEDGDSEVGDSGDGDSEELLNELPWGLQFINRNNKQELTTAARV
jgi:hypothetical protein